MSLQLALQSTQVKASGFPVRQLFDSLAQCATRLRRQGLDEYLSLRHPEGSKSHPSQRRVALLFQIRNPGWISSFSCQTRFQEFPEWPPSGPFWKLLKS